MIVMVGNRAPPPASGTSAPLCFPSLTPPKDTKALSPILSLDSQLIRNRCWVSTEAAGAAGGTGAVAGAGVQLVLVALVTPAPLLLPH